MTGAALRLRIATPDDARAVSGILAASYSTIYRGWYRDELLEKALPAMTRARPELLASGRYFIVAQDGVDISCGGWSLENPGGAAKSGIGHIRHFATHPAVLNRGAAGAILQRCLDEARAAGVVEMECLSSLAAEAFYMKHGFVTAAPTTVMVGGASFACMSMRRNLGT